ncbi:hypothetical protein, partial [Roseiarcus sp.]|uniref:hypothetical protein n=1 Tax=Roseiarcus sp. TaxID=1969460 RepID=UPI003D0F4F56
MAMRVMGRSLVTKKSGREVARPQVGPSERASELFVYGRALAASAPSAYRFCEWASAKMTIPNAKEIAKRAGDRAFGNPLVENTWRSHVVEMIVESVLSAEWKWSAEGWSGWDFEHVKTGLRLEVKQSAAKQSWKGTPKRPSPPKFSIKTAKVHWTDGVNPKPLPGRAEIYVFAYHPIKDDTADHRDPLQWTFFVVRTRDLPEAEEIFLSELSGNLSIAELAASVEAARLS